MRIAGSYTLPFDREKTYGSLHNPLISARCLPGCDALEQMGEDEYAMRMKLELAGFSSVFTGTIKIIEANPPQSFKMLVDGSGRGGFLKGEGIMNLAPSSGGTELTYDGDVRVGGSIAAFGQRVIDSTAKLMIRRFFERFIDEVNKAL